MYVLYHDLFSYLCLTVIDSIGTKDKQLAVQSDTNVEYNNIRILNEFKHGSAEKKGSKRSSFVE